MRNTMKEIEILKGYHSMLTSLATVAALNQEQEKHLKRVTTELREQLDQPMFTSNYANSGGSYCPYCRGPDLEGGAWESKGKEASQVVSCLECGGTWLDNYHLTGYIACKNPNPENLFQPKPEPKPEEASP